MPKQSVQQFSTTAAANTDIDGISVATGWPPSNVGPAFREFMALIASALVPLALDVTAQTNVTLTAAQASAQALTLTGALASGCTVTVPDALFVGLVQNATTGAQDVVLGAGIGATATVPPDGKWYGWFADGATNVALIGINGDTLNIAGDAAIGGDATIGGEEMLAGNLRMVNNRSIYMKDSGGTYRIVLLLNGSDHVYSSVAGGVDWNIVNQSLGQTLFSIDNSGNIKTGSGQSDNPVGTQANGWYFAVNGTTGGFSSAGTPLTLGSSTSGLIAFFNGAGTQVGSITTDGSTTAFNMTSDYRLKVSYGAFEIGGLVDHVPVHDAAFKTDPSSRRPMFFAHELALVAPWAVTGERDATDITGDIIPQMVDHVALIPMLWAEIQGLRHRVASLEAFNV